MGFENGSLVRVVLQATRGSQTNVNVLHYDLDSATVGLNDNSHQDLADRFRDDVMPTLKACYSSAWMIQPVIVEQEKDPLAPTAARSSWVSGVAGAGSRATSSDELPPGICGICTWITDHIGRRARGRMFLGGSIVENDQSAGTVGSSMTDLWEAFAAAIPKQPDIAGGGGITDAVANLSVYSRTARGANQDPYASHVKAHIIRTKLHYLRSRAN